MVVERCILQGVSGVCMYMYMYIDVSLTFTKHIHVCYSLFLIIPLSFLFFLSHLFLPPYLSPSFPSPLSFVSFSLTLLLSSSVCLCLSLSLFPSSLPPYRLLEKDRKSHTAIGRSSSFRSVSDSDSINSFRTAVCVNGDRGMYEWEYKHVCMGI